MLALRILLLPLPSEEVKAFNASSGLPHRVKQWRSFDVLKLSGTGGNGHEVAASKFPEEFEKIVENWSIH
jgi:hypothetical protein